MIRVVCVKPFLWALRGEQPVGMMAG